jgi:hypothetical protein
MKNGYLKFGYVNELYKILERFKLQIFLKIEIYNKLFQKIKVPEMKDLPANVSTLTKEDHKTLSFEISNRYIKTEENLDATKLLISYLEKDFKGSDNIFIENMLHMHKSRLEYYTQKVEKLKHQLTTLANLYESRFEKGVVRRFWEN